MRRAEDAIFRAVKVSTKIIHFDHRCKDMERTIFYVDGFNLYFGIKELRQNSLKWLDVNLLAKNLLKSHQELKDVYFFTSRVTNSPGKEKRQLTYIEALDQHSNIKIVFGKFQPNYITCKSCAHVYSSPSEKMTDVNIAVQMLQDAYQDKFDTAVLISGDSDLLPPIIAIKKLFPIKKVVVAFPPNRHNRSLQKHASGSFIIGRKKLKDSQLPDTVIKRDGYVLTRPAEWT